MKLPNAVPKPAKRPATVRKRIKAINRKRGGSSFPKQRDRAYTMWLVEEHPCLLAGRTIKHCVSPRDCPFMWDGLTVWSHRCWGELDPAHVGKHRSQGAPDVGAAVPLCRSAHRYYDEHRGKWAYVTGLSEKKMASAAAGYAARYTETEGARWR